MPQFSIQATPRTPQLPAPSLLPHPCLAQEPLRQEAPSLRLASLALGNGYVFIPVYFQPPLLQAPDVLFPAGTCPLADEQIPRVWPLLAEAGPEGRALPAGLTAQVLPPRPESP